MTKAPCGFVMSTHLGLPQIVCNKESGHNGDHAMTFPVQSYPSNFTVGGVAAPLEPTPPNVHTSYEEWAAKQNRMPDMLDFAEFHAAAVSKKLREEYERRLIEEKSVQAKWLCDKIDYKDETIRKLSDDVLMADLELEKLRPRITALEQYLAQVKEKK